VEGWGSRGEGGTPALGLHQVCVTADALVGGCWQKGGRGWKQTCACGHRAGLCWGTDHCLLSFISVPPPHLSTHMNCIVATDILSMLAHADRPLSTMPCCCCCCCQVGNLNEAAAADFAAAVAAAAGPGGQLQLRSAVKGQGYQGHAGQALAVAVSPHHVSGGSCGRKALGRGHGPLCSVWSCTVVCSCELVHAHATPLVLMWACSRACNPPFPSSPSHHSTLPTRPMPLTSPGAHPAASAVPVRWRGWRAAPAPPPAPGAAAAAGTQRCSRDLRGMEP
jgi:hypothetical protein